VRSIALELAGTSHPQAKKINEKININKDDKCSQKRMGNTNAEQEGKEIRKIQRPKRRPATPSPHALPNSQDSWPFIVLASILAEIQISAACRQRPSPPAFTRHHPELPAPNCLDGVLITPSNNNTCSAFPHAHVLTRRPFEQ
jgi:hypothetical protein